MEDNTINMQCEQNTTKIKHSDIPMSYEDIVHNLRKDIDVVIKRTEAIKNDITLTLGKREIVIVYTKLQEAKMWAGKVLEEIGSKLPEQYRDEAK